MLKIRGGEILLVFFWLKIGFGGIVGFENNIKNILWIDIILLVIC